MNTDDGNACTTDACNPSTGAITHIAVVTDDGNACTVDACNSITGVITHIANQPTTCAIIGNSDICFSGNTTLSVSSVGTYLWSTGQTTSTITVTSAGLYSVIVTSNSGCSSTCSLVVTSHNCGITLRKTPDKCEFPDGVATIVNFEYVVKNNIASGFSASGILTDDNGTPFNKSDDFLVCNWGPIVPGDSTICYHAFNISSTHTNIAIASGTSGGSSVSAIATATVKGVNCNCNLNYPDNSNLPRSAVIFNESEVLRTSEPGPTTCANSGSKIKLWYNDEHAMLLGVKSVSVKTFGGTSTTNYNVSLYSGSPSCISNPNMGDTITSGDQAANDIADGGGRPLRPLIFITDLTVNGANSRIGDWQQGGIGISPTGICGSWKSATKLIDKTKNPPLVTITTDPDPAKNNWNLGSGSDTPAEGFASLRNEGYGTEVSWDINSLGLIPGHDYRVVFMVHDGDQNKTGGDVGETCTTIHIPDGLCNTFNTPPPPPPPSDKVCYKGTTHSYVRASQSWTINTTTNQATIRTTFSKNFVDNTYGTNAISWPSGHTFSNLVGSDHVQMALYDGNNVKKMEFKVDYITASSTVASGYKCLGVLGGEGGMLLGNASDVVSATTSIDKNLNTFGYVLTTNSPATDNNYTPNATYPNWIYDVWYEVTINLSSFGSAGFGRPVITFVHASPSKTGSNSEIVVDTTCTQDFPRFAVSNSGVSKNIATNVYPNPTSSIAHFNFLRNNGRAHTVIEVYTISGQKIATLFDGEAEQDILYNVDLNTENLSEGTYLYRIMSDDEVINGKLVLIK